MKIVLCQGKTLISKLIRWQTRSQYSHVAIVLDDGSILESWHKGGVQHNKDLSVRHSKGTVIDLYDIVVTKEQETKIISFFTKQLGKKYDFKMVLRFLTHGSEAGGIKYRWFCSEIVFAAFQYAGINLLENTRAWECPPAWINKSHLLKYTQTFTI